VNAARYSSFRTGASRLRCKGQQEAGIKRQVYAT
jgi:hypothetical protein